jgi:hypothetical protein
VSIIPSTSAGSPQATPHLLFSVPNHDDVGLLVEFDLAWQQLILLTRSKMVPFFTRCVPVAVRPLRLLWADLFSRTLHYGFRNLVWTAWRDPAEVWTAPWFRAARVPGFRRGELRCNRSLLVRLEVPRRGAGIPLRTNWFEGHTITWIRRELL